MLSPAPFFITTGLVEAFDKASVDTLLGYVRVLLHTNKQGLPRNGRIADIIGAALVQGLEDTTARKAIFLAISSPACT